MNDPDDVPPALPAPYDALPASIRSRPRGLLAGADVRGFAESIALTPEATSRALAALVRRGLLVRESRGRYALGADGTPSPRPSAE